MRERERERKGEEEREREREGERDSPRVGMGEADSWSLSHLGYLYPGTTPVMIKLDHNRICPWV